MMRGGNIRWIEAILNDRSDEAKTVYEALDRIPWSALSETDRRWCLEMYAALKAYEKLDDFHANCEECDGANAPEACEACFPFADDARLKMRAVLARVSGPKK